MKIYILDSKTANLQLALDTAGLVGADVLLVEKSGEITAAYPISESGKKDLDTLKLRSHQQPEYNTSFYPLPFVLYDALVHLNSKFQLEWHNPPIDAKAVDSFRHGDLVVCPTQLNYEILIVTNVRPVAPGSEKMVGHTQYVMAETKRVKLTLISGTRFVLVSRK